RWIGAISPRRWPKWKRSKAVPPGRRSPGSPTRAGASPPSRRSPACRSARPRSSPRSPEPAGAARGQPVDSGCDCRGRRMIRLVLFLLAAVAASLAAAWLADNPGRVALTWQGMHIETSFAVMAIALVLLVLLAIALFELLRLLGAAPRRISRHMRRSRTDKGYRSEEHTSELQSR